MCTCIGGVVIRRDNLVARSKDLYACVRRVCVCVFLFALPCRRDSLVALSEELMSVYAGGRRKT